MSNNPLDRIDRALDKDRDGTMDLREGVDKALDRDRDGTMDLREGGADRTRTRATETSGDVRVPVAEERLNVEKRASELGEVEIRKTVEQEQVSVPVELRREEVRVDQRNVADRPARDGEDLFQEGTIRVPVRGEEAVVTKEAVVTGEVVVDKTQTTDRQTVADTVRRERVEVDKDYEQHRGAFQQHYTRRQGQLTGQYANRRFEDAEPNYQYGYAAARDTQYGNRPFEDVESDLRGDYERRVGSGKSSGTGDDWEHLREEIREGYNRVRNS